MDSNDKLKQSSTSPIYCQDNKSELGVTSSVEISSSSLTTTSSLTPPPSNDSLDNSLVSGEFLFCYSI